MKIDHINREEKTIKYVIKLEQNEWKEIFNSTKKDLKKNLQIKGFRKGNVPDKIASEYVTNEKIFGASIDKISNLIDKEFFKLIPQEDKSKIIPNSFASKINKMDQNDVEIEISFENHPIVEVKDCDKMKLHYKKPEVTNDEVNSELKQILREDYMLSEKKDGIIAKGTMVKFDFKGFVDNKPFDGGESKDFELEIGSNTFIPGFEDQMVGMKKGDKKKINVVFPKDYIKKELANKPAEFELEIKEVNDIKAPIMDAAYLKKLQIPNIETENDLRKFIKNAIFKQKNLLAKKKPIEEIINHIKNNTQINFIPQSMVNHYVNQIISKEINDAKSNKKKIEDVFKSKGFSSLEEYAKKLETNAKNELLITFGISSLLNKFKIKIEEKEIDEQLINIANAYGIKLEEIKKNQQLIDNLSTNILQEKLFDHLIEINKNN